MTIVVIWRYINKTELKTELNLKKSHQLDLTKQWGKSLPLDNHYIDDYVSAGNKLYNPNWCKSFSFFISTIIFMEEMWSERKILNDHDRQSLKRLVKSNCKKQK